MKTTAEMTDQELLRSFTADHQETAFEELVRRHGPMVMGICHRILCDPHDASDAFQAVFLILVRKAGALAIKDSVGGWLYRVSTNTALKAKKRATLRARREQPLEDDMHDHPVDESNQRWEEIRPVIDEELGRLPEKYRAPAVLCYLEGRTYEDAGRELGLSYTTVKMRLERSRDLLKERFAHRGILLSGAVLTTLLTNNMSAAVPVEIAVSTVKAATSLAAGKAIAGGLTAGVAELMKEVLVSMFCKKAIAVGAMVLALGTITTAISMTTILKTSSIARGERVQQAPIPPTTRDVSSRKAPEVKVDGHNPIAGPATALPQDVIKQLKEALGISKLTERWQALRNLGIDLSDEEFSKIRAETYPEWMMRDLSRDQFLSSLFTYWIKKEPLMAVKWVYNLQVLPVSELKLMPVPDLNSRGWNRPVSNQNELMVKVMWQWAHQDSESAYAWIRQLPKGVGRDLALKGFITSIGPSNPERALALMEELPSLDRYLTVSDIASEMVKQDPQKAAAWVERFPVDDGNGISLREGAIGSVALAWGFRDPVAALQWLGGLTDDKARREGTERLVHAWVHYDFAAARKWAENLPENEKRSYSAALGGIASAMAEDDAPAAIQWARNHLQPAELGEVLPEIARVWARKNPEAAAKWAENLPAGTERDKVYESIVQPQVSAAIEKASTLDEAAAIIETLPREYQEQNQWLIVHHGLEKDPNALVEWIRKQPSGARKDHLIFDCIPLDGGRHIRIDPSLAAKLADDISDSTVRTRTLVTVAEAWLSRDRNRAAQWVAQSELPRKIKEVLLSPQFLESREKNHALINDLLVKQEVATPAKKKNSGLRQ